MKRPITQMYKSLYKAHINVSYLRLLRLLARTSLSAPENESSQSKGGKSLRTNV